MKNFLGILLSSIIALSPVLGGNILVVHFTNVGSFVRIIDEVLRTLAPYHNITLYSIVHEKPPHPNVNLVKVRAPPQKGLLYTDLFETLCINGILYTNYKILTSVEENFIDEIFADKKVKNLITSKGKYDALITFTTLSEFVYQLSSVLQVPLIQVSSPVPFSFINDAVGNPIFSSTVHTLFDLWPGHTFSERVLNYLTNLIVYIRYNWYYIPQIERITYKYYPRNTPSIAQVYRNTSLLIANMNNAMGHSRPNMPNVLNIGGIHCRPAKPLPDDIEDFIQGSGEHGIIYFSLGTSIRSKFPDYITQAIIRVFAKLPQRVLCKWNEDIENIPSNVKISKWFSQQDVLGHKKTRLFITQGGLFSMEETSYHGVPVLAIPIVTDQPFNVHVAHKLGYCEYISFCDFSEETFYQLIQKLILNRKYKENAVKISELMKDVPMTSHEELIWWINYIVRHKGNPILLEDKNHGLKKLELDLIVFLYILITIIIIIFMFVVIKINRTIQRFKTNITYKNKKI